MTHRYLLSGLVASSAEAEADSVAATFDESSLTWQELERRVGQLAAVLAGSRVERGDRVGIHLHKSMESLVAVHGILRAGAAYVPIDPMAPADTVAAIVADCGISTIVTHELRRPGVERLVTSTELSTIIGLDQPVAGAGGPVPVSWAEVDQVEPIPPVPVLGEDLAYVMYTSGSTGTPKGIMHTHRSGLAYAAMSAELYGLGPSDRMANFSPLHFDMSTFEILAGVAAAARIVLVPEPYLRLPASLTTFLADQGCTTLYTVPSLFQQMLTRGGLAERDLSAVRWVLPAGEVFPPEPLQTLLDLLPHARFSNVYGPAEVNQITYHHFSAGRDRPTGEEPLPIGYPCPDVELRIVDDDDRPTEDGQHGELLARTATMMAGYWNRPDLDRRGFLDETGPGGLRRRWYRTGDIVSRQGDGPIRYYGRRDNQVKIRGNRVELEMVEAAVGSLDSVEQAVVGVRTRPGGDDDLVVKYVATGPVESDRWRQALAGRLPTYAVPTAFEEVDGFPLTPSGKIDRRTVRRQIAAPEPTTGN